MKHLILGSILLAAGAAIVALAIAPDAKGGVASPADLVARGRYIVESFGCVDCHTPHVLGPNGPEPDRTRHLSGHPADMQLPPAPALPPGPWIASIAASMTAWSGPWGTSFTANLTPDVETGLGAWTPEDFIATLKTGRHMGRGREILPPMPITMIRNMTEDDMRAMFAYLRSLPAVKNRVPDPLPPVEAR
ncbi:MAG: c-type cytochrome [Planctomycetes bacterium]|nr:c-type cytochrome [Planctomycetota bacterium]